MELCVLTQFNSAFSTAFFAFSGFNEISTTGLNYLEPGNSLSKTVVITLYLLRANIGRLDEEVCVQDILL